MTARLATEADLPALRELMALAIDRLQSDFLTPEQVAASRKVMGLDSQLVADRTYYLVERDGRVAGCGGWSRRATLYGGDHAKGRDAALLDPATDAARIRAMYTHPDFVRQGVGRQVLSVCEAAARAEGFTRAEMMATLAGAALYRACGYAEIERVFDAVPLVRMVKSLTASPTNAAGRQIHL